MAARRGSCDGLTAGPVEPRGLGLGLRLPPKLAGEAAGSPGTVGAHGMQVSPDASGTRTPTRRVGVGTSAIRKSLAPAVAARLGSQLEKTLLGPGPTVTAAAASLSLRGLGGLARPPHTVTVTVPVTLTVTGLGLVWILSISLIRG